MRHSRGNQVDDVSRAIHGIGSACIRRVPALICDLACTKFSRSGSRVRFITSCSDLASVLRLCFQKLGVIASEIFRKCWQFSCFSRNIWILFKILCGFCYTSPPRGNQVDDLSRVLHTGAIEIWAILADHQFSFEIFDIRPIVLLFVLFLVFCILEISTVQ